MDVYAHRRKLGKFLRGGLVARPSLPSASAASERFPGNIELRKGYGNLKMRRQEIPFYCASLFFHSNPTVPQPKLQLKVELYTN